MILKHLKKHLLFIGLIFFIVGCGSSKSTDQKDKDQLPKTASIYKGTASITQGIGKITKERIHQCEGGRKTDMGTITSTDRKTWTVPAVNNYNNEEIPFAPDLHNPCNGNTYVNATEALSKLDCSDIIEIDPDGDLYTAYIFADNYFEMYVNGIPVGKDRVPFTAFNSSIIRYKVTKPYTIAMKLVDWEEHLGLGTEKSRGTAFHAGDGGIVAVIKDEDSKTIAITDEHWKAQTFYTAPIKDLSCVNESGMIRSSQNCDQSDSDDGTYYFGLHWEVPSNWEQENFDDSTWPSATTYANNTIGVDNKKSYTNFTDIFDDESSDAKFIWSSNVVLDNEVIVRYTVE